MRLTANGIDFMPIVLAMRGAFMAFLLTLSRWARDLWTMNMENTVSMRLRAHEPKR